MKNLERSEHRLARFARSMAAVLALGLLMSTHAGAGSVVYQAEIPNQRPNFVPPGVLVGFNPQPEPPARLVVAGELGHPPDPGVTFSGIGADRTELLLGIGGGHQRLAAMVLVGESCGVERNVRLYPIFREIALPEECRGSFRIRARFTDRTVLNLDVTVRSTRGDVVVPPGTLVGFNPQPEPPAIPAFGLRVETPGADAVTVDLALSDRRANVIPLR